MIFQPEIETLGREEMRALQLQRLQQTVRYVYERVPLYRERLDALKVRPEDIRSLDDVRRLPFTTKEDFRANYPYGLFAVPMKDIVRIHASSGTTGKPTVGAYTKEDIENWSDFVARIVTASGVTSDDIIQISFGYGLFTGALGLHFGLEKVGATVIPASSGNSEKQLMMLRDFGVTGLVATPSYALYLGELVRESPYPKEAYASLKYGILGSEGCTEEMRQRIEENLGVTVTDNYGMTELTGPGVSGECHLRCGLHFAEDAVLPEIIDQDTLEQKPAGEVGELVVTTLTRKGMPVLRYRTKDITRLHYEPCACGRTHVRMGRVMGRTDDMLIIRGVNVFPSQIEHALLQVPGIEPHYHIVVDRVGTLDTIEVQVELSPSVMSDTVRDLETLERKIVNSLASHALIHASVKLCQPGTLPRSEGKAVRVTDRRHLQ